jgi:hypothetical protein
MGTIGANYSHETDAKVWRNGSLISMDKTISRERREEIMQGQKKFTSLNFERQTKQASSAADSAPFWTKMQKAKAAKQAGIKAASGEKKLQTKSAGRPTGSGTRRPTPPVATMFRPSGPRAPPRVSYMGIRPKLRHRQLKEYYDAQGFHAMMYGGGGGTASTGAKPLVLQLSNFVDELYSHNRLASARVYQCFGGIAAQYVGVDGVSELRTAEQVLVAFKEALERLVEEAEAEVDSILDVKSVAVREGNTAAAAAAADIECAMHLLEMLSFWHAQHHAATTIQCSIRHKRSRAHVADLREEHTARYDAATRIQNKHRQRQSRGVAVRKREQARQQAAAMSIQSKVRQRKSVVVVKRRREKSRNQAHTRWQEQQRGAEEEIARQAAAVQGIERSSRTKMRARRRSTTAVLSQRVEEQAKQQEQRRKVKQQKLDMLREHR